MSVFNVAVQLGDADLCFSLRRVVHSESKFFFRHNRGCCFRLTLLATPTTACKFFATIESVNFYFLSFHLKSLMKKMKSEKRKENNEENKKSRTFFSSFEEGRGSGENLYLLCSVIYFLSFGFKFFNVDLTEKFVTRLHFYKKKIKDVTNILIIR